MTIMIEGPLALPQLGNAQPLSGLGSVTMAVASGPWGNSRFLAIASPEIYKVSGDAYVMTHPVGRGVMPKWMGLSSRANTYAREGIEQGVLLYRQQLQERLDAGNPIKAGEAVVTEGCGLSSKKIIHVATKGYAALDRVAGCKGEAVGSAKLYLRDAEASTAKMIVRSALAAAACANVFRVVFPIGFPNLGPCDAAAIMANEVRKFWAANMYAAPVEVIFAAGVPGGNVSNEEALNAQKALLEGGLVLIDPLYRVEFRKGFLGRKVDETIYAYYRGPVAIKEPLFGLPRIAARLAKQLLPTELFSSGVIDMLNAPDGALCAQRIIEARAKDAPDLFSDDLLKKLYEVALAHHVPTESYAFIALTDVADHKRLNGKGKFNLAAKISAQIIAAERYAERTTN